VGQCHPSLVSDITALLYSVDNSKNILTILPEYIRPTDYTDITMKK